MILISISIIAQAAILKLVVALMSVEKNLIISIYLIMLKHAHNVRLTVSIAILLVNTSL